MAKNQNNNNGKPSTVNGKLTVVTYKTKRGADAPQIVGFAGEDDPRWKAHKESGAKWASASFRRDLNGEKVYLLMFGTKYMTAAQTLCDAYNAGDAKAIERARADCQAIMEQSMAEGKAKWEAKKAEWAKKKEEKKAQKQAEKLYTAAEVASMLSTLLAGGDVPEDIKKLIKKAA